LIEVVPQLVMDRGEVLGRLVDAHLDAQVAEVVDVPGAGVTHDLAILRPHEQRALPERLRQRIEPEGGEEPLAGFHHVCPRRLPPGEGTTRAPVFTMSLAPVFRRLRMSVNEKPTSAFAGATTS